jgi:hypothetical protein
MDATGAMMAPQEAVGEEHPTSWDSICFLYHRGPQEGGALWNKQQDFFRLHSLKFSWRTSCNKAFKIYREKLKHNDGYRAPAATPLVGTEAFNSNLLPSPPDAPSIKLGMFPTVEARFVEYVQERLRRASSPIRFSGLCAQAQAVSSDCTPRFADPKRKLSFKASYTWISCVLNRHFSPEEQTRLI